MDHEVVHKLMPGSVGWGAAATCLVVALGGCSRGPSAAHGYRDAPVIIVDIDTLRADHLGCYGYQRPTSPNIDAWSREAIRFEWAFAQAPNTPPSQSSILTGLYPSIHGRIRGNQVLRDEVLTLAELMSEQGYATAGFVDGGNMVSAFGMGQGFDVYDDAGGGLDAFGPDAVDWLRDHSDGKFLLLLHTFDVHSPYEATPEPFNSAFIDEVELPSELFRSKMSEYMHSRRLSKNTRNPFRLTPVEVDYARARYDGGILHVDDWFGQFWRLLRESGLDSRAIVVLISDHGDEFEEHDSVFHERIYATITRVPLLIRLPGGGGARSVEEVVETIDLLPTLLDLTGTPVPPFLNGRTLVPLLAGREIRSQSAVSESRFFGGQLAVADHALRLVYSRRDGKMELYRYRDDPLEQLDIFSTRGIEARRLMDVLKRWEFSVRAGATAAPTVDEIDDRTFRQLEALGYIEHAAEGAPAVPFGDE